MKARTKITLLTSCFAIISTLGFSAVVFLEFFEQTTRLIDGDLYEVSEQLHDYLAEPAFLSGKDDLLIRHPFDKYWIQVRSDDGRIIRRTRITQGGDIDFRANDRNFFTFIPVDLGRLWLTKADRKEVADDSPGDGVLFRAYNETYAANGSRYQLIIARPVPFLGHEIKELVIGVIIGVTVCTVAVVIAGYYMAGSILKPISQINREIREITGTSLNRRLSVGRSRDELQNLSLSLNSMLDRLEHSFVRQKEFIGNASHELKSPLTILMLGQEKMLSEELPEHIQSNIEKQLNTTRRVSKLVRNLLELSRLEQQDYYNEKEVNLKETVLTQVEEFEELLAERAIAVTCRLDDVSIRGDREKLSQLLINLIDNAIKYNLPEHGKIDIELDRQKDLAILKVANTGQLIPPESIDRIFDQFYRVEKSRSTEYGGSGLGLTIVRHIVELHRGSIVVHNDPAGWIVFTVSLPG